MNDRGQRTQFAMKALDLAQMFRSSLGVIAIGAYHAELTAPDGPSTGGGVQAVQHLRLCADDGRPAIVIGSCNQREGTAELRSWDALDQVHRQRFKRPLEVERIAYGQFVTKAKAFLEAVGLRVTVSVAQAEEKPASGSGLLAAFLLGALVVGGLVWLLLRRFG